MGGTSKSSSESTQQSQLTPWGPAAGGLQGILSGLNPSIDNLNGGPQVSDALGKLEANAQQPNPLGSGALAAGSSLLNGGPNIGGATGILQNGYNSVSNALSPFLTGAIGSDPGTAQALSNVQTDVGNTVNPMFSAAGRLGSPSNYQAVARGIAQGSAPILQNAASNRLAAAQQLSGAGLGTASGLTGADVANAGILGSGLNNAQTAYNAQNFGPQALLSAALFGNQLPIQNAGALSGILGPLAATFGQNNGSGTQQGTQTMSGVQQFGSLMGGLGGLFNLFKPAGPTIKLG